MSEAGALSDDEASPEDLDIGSDIGPSLESGPSSAPNGPSHTQPGNRPGPTDVRNDNPQPSHSAQGRKVPGQSRTILPAEKVFPIQVGTELFRLSGASIASDGPSYFTQFFEDQIRQNEESGGVRTLYIDRDPVTFRDIARHLQGYYIKPANGGHFVRLFADAQFYSLPRLITQLFESEIFIQIGGQHFQIPKDLFSDPGNSPNFFSLGFAVFFATPNDVFPGLDKRGLLRPPPINPPHVPTRSSEIFSQLLHLLRGYPLKIRDETHRAELIRDCRYFHLRGLEQRIIAHDISYNLHRKRTEICLRLEDIKPSGISYQAESREDPLPSSIPSQGGGWVYYSRPFVDESPYELIMEIGGESSEIDLHDMRATFHGSTRARMVSLLQVIANKMNLTSHTPLGLLMLSGRSPSPALSPGSSSLSDDRVKVQFECASLVTLDGQPCDVDRYLLGDNSTEQNSSAGGPEVKTVPTDTHDTNVINTRSAQSHRNQTHKNGTSYSRPSRTQTAPEPVASSSHRPSSSTSLSTATPTSTDLPPKKKRKLESSTIRTTRWVIKTGQWRLRILPSQDPARSGYELTLVAVRLDAFSNERARNDRRGFLLG